MSELTVKINVDADDAIEKIAQVKRALREMNETAVKVGVVTKKTSDIASKSIEQFQRDSYLHDVTTRDLINELVKRTGVYSYEVDPYKRYTVKTQGKGPVQKIATAETGPALILVVTD
jgi:hypothetical protein